MLRAAASLQCRVGGASAPRSARLAVPLCWQCSKGSAALSLPQRCPTALQRWRGGSPTSPHPRSAPWPCSALQPCSAGWAAALHSCSVPEVMAAAVPAVQAVMDGRELSAGSAPCPCSAGCMAALHPCSNPWPSIPAWVAALHPCTALCPLRGCQPCVPSMSRVPVSLDGCQPHIPAVLDPTEQAELPVCGSHFCSAGSCVQCPCVPAVCGRQCPCTGGTQCSCVWVVRSCLRVWPAPIGLLAAGCLQSTLLVCLVGSNYSWCGDEEGGQWQEWLPASGRAEVSMTGLLTPAGRCRNSASWDGSFGALEAARSQPQQPLPFGSRARTVCSPTVG